MRSLLISYFQENRPDSNEKTRKTYVSLLSNLYKTLGKSEEEPKIDWFDKNKNNILQSIKDKPVNSQKTILSALYLLTKDKEFQTHMLNKCKIVNNQYKTQQKTSKEQDNWLSSNEIKVIYDKHLDKVKTLFRLKVIDENHYPIFIQYFLLACLTGFGGIEPRRLLDYSLMKIRNYNKETDNYYYKGKFYFNVYKTSQQKGLKVIVVPKLLNGYIKKWININPTDYFLFSKVMKPLSSSQMTKTLNKIFFPKQISIDILRHIYLTEMYKNTPALQQMEETASNMGHSVITALQYAKKD